MFKFWYLGDPAVIERNLKVLKWFLRNIHYLTQSVKCVGLKGQVFKKMYS